MENRDTYRDPDLSHRRAVVYFSSADVFVVVDEAIGPARGLVEVHFHLHGNRGVIDKVALAARSTGTSDSEEFDRGTDNATTTAGVVVRSWAGDAHMNVSLRRSYQSAAMGRQRERAVVTFSQHKATEAALRFVTVVAPFNGPHAPHLRATIVEPPGATSVTVSLWREAGTGERCCLFNLERVVLAAGALGPRVSSSRAAAARMRIRGCVGD